MVILPIGLALSACIAFVANLFAKFSRIRFDPPRCIRGEGAIRRFVIRCRHNRIACGWSGIYRSPTKLQSLVRYPKFALKALYIPWIARRLTSLFHAKSITQDSIVCGARLTEPKARRSRANLYNVAIEVYVWSVWRSVTFHGRIECSTLQLPRTLEWHEEFILGWRAQSFTLCNHWGRIWQLINGATEQRSCC